MPLARRSTTFPFLARHLWRLATRRRPASFEDIELFSGAPQHEHLARVRELAPTRKMARSSTIFRWPTGEPTELPSTYSFAGQVRSTADFLVETDTAALLVLADGKVRYERYFLTGGPQVQWMSFSVAKSFVSALVGIAVDEGHIASIDQPISDYVPVDPGSAYDGVPIRTVLQMSSGARWNEDYSDPESDIHQLVAANRGKRGGLDGFVARMWLI